MARPVGRLVHRLVDGPARGRERFTVHRVSVRVMSRSVTPGTDSGTRPPRRRLAKRATLGGMSATSAYLKAALVGLAVLWLSAVFAGPSGAIASAAIAMLALVVVAAARRHIG